MRVTVTFFDPRARPGHRQRLPITVEVPTLWRAEHVARARLAELVDHSELFPVYSIVAHREPAALPPVTPRPGPSPHLVRPHPAPPREETDV